MGKATIIEAQNSQTVYEEGKKDPVEIVKNAINYAKMVYLVN